MRRLFVCAGFLLFAPAVLAQAVTRPTVTVAAGAMRVVFPFSDSRAYYAVALGGEIPVYGRGRLSTSVGAAGRAASGVFEDGLRPQSVSLYARAGTAKASARLGVAFDVGGGLFDSDGLINSDGQTAVVAGLSGTVPAGGVRAFAVLDAALALPSDGQFFIASPGAPEGRTYPVRLNLGHQGSVQVGAAVPVSSVEVALAVFVAGRSEGSYRYTDDVPPPFETGNETVVEPREGPFQFGYSRAVGLIPSATYRVPGRRLTLRLDGSFTGYFSMEDTPLGFTVSTGGGPDVRALTLSASVGL